MSVSNNNINDKQAGRCCVALGSNIPSKFGNPLKTLDKALAELQSSNFKLIKCSNFYETEPYPKSLGSKFINCCAIFQSNLSAVDVLNHLHKVESNFGRIRDKRWGSRIIDLDLIYFDDLVYPNHKILNKWIMLSQEEQIKSWPLDMILPHPRLQDRAFVLIPMSDIDQDWLHPTLKKTVKEMLPLIDPNLLNEVKKL